jgi:hypothetical protein
MTGMPSPADPGMPTPAATGTVGSGTARKSLTGRPQEPCSHPPKSCPEAYPRRRGARRDRTRTHCHGDSRRPVRVVLQDEPPRLTPAAARALLRVLLKAHAAQIAQQTSDSGQEGKG